MSTIVPAPPPSLRSISAVWGESMKDWTLPAMEPTTIRARRAVITHPMTVPRARSR